MFDAHKEALEHAARDAARALYHEQFARDEFNDALAELARQLGTSRVRDLDTEGIMDTGPDGLLSLMRQLATEREARAAEIRQAAEACRAAATAADEATAEYR